MRMSGSTRIVLMIISIAIAVFGALCLNYAKPSALDHHRARAVELKLPAPSDGIMLMGGAALLVAGGCLGAVGARRGR